LNDKLENSRYGDRNWDGDAGKIYFPKNLCVGYECSSSLIQTGGEIGPHHGSGKIKNEWWYTIGWYFSHLPKNECEY
jgi:hypothetical protein